MLFLIQEQIKVNLAIHNIFLPTSKAMKDRPATMRSLNSKRIQTKPARPDPQLTTDYGTKPHLTGTSLGITALWKPVLSQDDA